ncbi:hypothetical protein ACI65C_012309, partial [Semiaphis heraclei]
YFNISLFLINHLRVINRIISYDSRLQCDCRRLLLIESLSNEYEYSGTGEGSFHRPGAIGRCECHNILLLNN